MSDKRKPLRINLAVEGARPLLSALNKMPKALQMNLRVASQAIADEEADAIQAAAKTSDSMSALVAPTVRSRKDRVPMIIGGGARKLTQARGKPRAYDLFFGAEFGGQQRPTTQQFRPHKGKLGYWFWPTIRRDEPQIVGHWMDAIDDVVAEWEAGATS